MISRSKSVKAESLTKTNAKNGLFVRDDKTKMLVVMDRFTSHFVLIVQTCNLYRTNDKMD